jgi:hypothetical protein
MILYSLAPAILSLKIRDGIVRGISSAQGIAGARSGLATSSGRTEPPKSPVFCGLPQKMRP